MAVETRSWGLLDMYEDYSDYYTPQYYHEYYSTPSNQYPSHLVPRAAAATYGAPGVAAPLKKRSRYRLDPATKKQHQRKAANNRERKRMRSINTAFEGLRKRLPVDQTDERKLSKVETLRYAIQYIQNLAEILDALEAKEDSATKDIKAKVIIKCRIPRPSTSAATSSSTSIDTSDPSSKKSSSNSGNSSIDEENLLEGLEELEKMEEEHEEEEEEEEDVFCHSLSWSDTRAGAVTSKNTVIAKTWKPTQVMTGWGYREEAEASR